MTKSEKVAKVLFEVLSEVSPETRVDIIKTLENRGLKVDMEFNRRYPIFEPHTLEELNELTFKLISNDPHQCPFAKGKDK
jgi:hypothetical protein